MDKNDLKKLDTNKMSKISGGVYITSFNFGNSVYVSLEKEDKYGEDLFGVIVKSDDPNWREKAAWEILTNTWGAVDSKDLTSAIDNWLESPGFCAGCKSKVDHSPITRIQNRFF